MKKLSILFAFSLFLIVSCNKKAEVLDIKKYADKFKFKQLEAFDARTLQPDLNQIEDKGLLNNLWESKDKFTGAKNYFYSLQDGNNKNQEFTVVLGDLDKKDEPKQIWYFVYSAEGKQLARFIIAEVDASANTYAVGSIKKAGVYSVSNYQKDKLINNKTYSIDEKGNLKEGTAEAVKEESNTGNAAAQEFHAKDVFTQKNLVYTGIDFTHAKFVGKALQDVGEIKNKFFREWNDVVTEEKGKFNITDFFNKENVTYDVANTNNRNAGRSTSSMYSKTKAPSLSQGIVQGVLGNVSLKEKHGIGTLLVVEAFDDEHDQAVVWVTLFDIASKKLLITERLTSKPHGGGLRNYWINAVYDILVHVDRVSYAAWKKSYGK